MVSEKQSLRQEKYRSIVNISMKSGFWLINMKIIKIVGRFRSLLKKGLSHRIVYIKNSLSKVSEFLKS